MTLPLSYSRLRAHRLACRRALLPRASAGKPAVFLLPTRHFHSPARSAAAAHLLRASSARPTFRAPNPRGRGWWGGEGSNLRSPKAAGLQPAAIDRSATSPKYISCCSSGHDSFGSQHLYPLRPWAVALKPAHVIGVRVSDVSLKGGVTVHGAGGGIRTPDLLITNQLLYRPELRQPDKEQIIALPVPAEQLDGLSRQIWRGSRDRSGLPQPTPTASII